MYKLSYLNTDIDTTKHDTLDEAMRQGSADHRVDHPDVRMVWIMVLLDSSDEHWQGFAKYPAEEATCVIIKQ